ncbi:MAG: fructose-1,6-bisphosphatase [Clostridia bacterium]|nr:fructose-1,6-bisphosphatase [Clostridia bacterium]
MNKTYKKYLQLLSKTYKNIDEVTTEIINLQAILNLPKGTELFMSDVHGEYEAFLQILNNGSGIIKTKIDEIYDHSISQEDRKNLATLIYYPEEKLEIEKKVNQDMAEYYSIMLYRLLEVARAVSSKYTRSKVRKAMPKNFDYIIDELLHTQGDDEYDKEKYYRQIIESIIDLNRADEFIIAISHLIKRMAIDHLHMIGDVYDRGPGAPIIMDKLMNFHSMDFQWGNHDILWMGAACGNKCCISNVVRICSRYDNLSTLEDGYGINIRPLSIFAQETYQNDPCKEFLPRTVEKSRYSNSDKILISKIQKAIAIIQFKLEGNLIKKHPEYNLDNRLLLDKVDYDKYEITINNKKFKLNDTNFPTIDPNNPYKLTKKEKEIINRLKTSFLNSEKLAKHVSFLYSKGHMYQVYNDNLLYHGCIPFTKKGEFDDFEIMGNKYKGKDLMDQMEIIAHKAFFSSKNVSNNEEVDFMWYLWCGPKSPLFGKDKVATFERYFIDEKITHREVKNPYYHFQNDEKICDKILKDFNVSLKDGHIINGHVPVKAKDGESPVRANGKLIVIDGGFAKSYQKSTGLAGYTLTYNSHGLVLAANEPFESKNKAILHGLDIKSQTILKQDVKHRKCVKDTDIGKTLESQVRDLKYLLEAYIDGDIKETI